MDESILKDLKTMRENFNLSQTRLAELANISLTTLRQLETGQQKPQKRTIKKIFETFERISNDPESIKSRNSSKSFPDEDYSSSMSNSKKKSITAKTFHTGSEFIHHPIRLTNIDLELINRILNMSGQDKLELLRKLL